MKKLSVAGLVAVVVLFVASLINAQPGPGMNMKDCCKFDGKGKGRFMEKLDLTDAQKDKIESLRTAHQKAMIDLKADLEKAQIELKELVDKGNIDRAKFLSAKEKIMKARNKIETSMDNHKMDVYEQFTPEQKKKVEDLVGWFMNHPGKDRGMRPFGRGGRGPCFQ